MKMKREAITLESVETHWYVNSGEPGVLGPPLL